MRADEKQILFLGKILVTNIYTYLKFRRRTSNQINKVDRHVTNNVIYGNTLPEESVYNRSKILERFSGRNLPKLFKRLVSLNENYPRSSSVLPAVGDVLRLLENGKWHSLKEIGEEIQLNDLKVKSVAKFLAQHSFIKLDDGEQKIKLDPSTQRFLKKIRHLEGEEKLKLL